MKCENCEKEISNDMRGALKSNACPWCSNSIMSPEKAEQYFNLIQLLDLTSFTNRQDVDTQIRTKVASLLVSNFIFMQIAPTIEEDVIVLDEPKPRVKHPPLTTSGPLPPLMKKVIDQITADSDEEDWTDEAVVVNPKLQKLDSHGRPMNTITEADLGNLDDSELKSIPTNTKPKVQPTSTGKKLSVQDYARIQNDMYDSSEPTQAAAPPIDLAANLQKDLQRLQKYQGTPKGLTGQGIKRV
jgi:hypothetical protein